MRKVKRAKAIWNPMIFLKFNLNLRQKMIIGLILYICFYISVGLATYNKFKKFNKDVTILIHAIKLSNICLEIRRYEKNFIIRHDINEHITAEKYITEAIEYAAKINNKFIDDENLPIMNRLEEIIKEYQIVFADLKLNAGPQPQGFDVEIQEKVHLKGKDMIKVSDSLVHNEQQNLEEFLRKVRGPIIMTLVLLVFFTVVTTIFLFKKLIFPLKLIEQAAKAIAKGTFIPFSEPKQNDEFQRVLQAFNGMVNELEQKQEQLIQAQKLSSIGTLASGTAHQLNNPLNNISTSCQIAIAELNCGDTEFINKMLQTIEQETRRAGEIVKGLLEFSRANTFFIRPVNLDEVVNKVLKLIESDVPTGITITKDIPDKLILDLDTQKMTEALLNLVINGIHAITTPPGTVSITVFCKKESSDAVIVIEDSGCGIDPKILQNIFDPFYTTKNVGKGTGLGLAVAYGIIKKHKGVIDVQSAPGQGSRFDITLPLSRDQRLNTEGAKDIEGNVTDARE